MESWRTDRFILREIGERSWEVFDVQLRRVVRFKRGNARTRDEAVARAHCDELNRFYHEQAGRRQAARREEK